MNVKEWLTEAKQQIDPVTAELLLLKYLGLMHEDRSYLVTHEDKEIDPIIVEMLNLQLSVAKMSDLPRARILNYQEFYGRKFSLDGNVMVPRYETEEAVDIILELKPASVLDVGTGSGCIGITVKCEMPQTNVTCSDISIGALAVAEQNAQYFEADCKLLLSDLLEDIRRVPELVVANLPYVDPSWSWVDKDALSHDPSSALYATEGGLYYIKKLIQQCQRRKVRKLVLEADPVQHTDIIKYAEQRGFSLGVAMGFILYFLSE